MSPASSDEAAVHEFLELPADMPQESIQAALEDVRREAGFPTAMECLYQWELAAGYITREKLESTERHTFWDAENRLNLRLQVNFARSGYAPKPREDPTLPPLHCAICRENVGRPGKENLRIFEFALGSEPFFLQLTPFPLFARHFVLILTEPRPQDVNRTALAQMLRFQELAPRCTICSNSDVEWAGSSILAHQHFQIGRGLHLPVMDARVALHRETADVEIELLRYPMTVLKVSGRKPASVQDAGGAVIEVWKARSPGKNTVNLVLRGTRDLFALYIILRNPDYRTPAELRHIKSEGVGVIEASGEAILPVPRDEATWRMVREGGLEIIKGIIGGNNPVKQGRERVFEQLAACL